jgi:hypothetical protein
LKKLEIGIDTHTLQRPWNGAQTHPNMSAVTPAAPIVHNTVLFPEEIKILTDNENSAGSGDLTVRFQPVRG